MASEKINALIEEVKALTVLELSELVHALEEEFGVSAAAMAAPAAGAAAAPVEEKTEFDVVDITEIKRHNKVLDCTLHVHYNLFLKKVYCFYAKINL